MFSYCFDFVTVCSCNMKNSTFDFNQVQLASPGPVATTFTVTVCVTTLAAFIGNLLVVVTFLKTPSLRTSTNYFIVNMAVSDLLLALMNWPLYMSSCRGLLTGNVALLICKFGLYSKIVSLAVSIESMVLIAVDRFLATAHPMKLTVFKRKRAIILISSWLIPLGYAFPYCYYSKIMVISKQHICLPSMGKLTSFIYGLMAFIVHYLAPLIINIILYSLILRSVRRPKPGNRLQRREENSRRRKQNQNVLKVVISIVSFFFLCWTPLYVYNFIYMIRRNLLSKHMLEVLNCLIYYIVPFLSTVVNPIILFMFGRNFRNALKKLFSCVCCKTRNQ